MTLMKEPPSHIEDQERATRLARARYDRIAGIYDRMGKRMERRFQPWRALLWSQVRGPRVLEVGVGTGKNLSWYRPEWQMTALDFSPGRLARARERAEREQMAVDLQLGDIQALPLASASFETVLATFVFCSVPDPVRGLREVARVLVPGGQLLLLEHVLSANRFLRPLMNLANPLTVRISGANINRETVANIERTGLAIQRVENLWGDIVKFIVAEKPR